MQVSETIRRYQKEYFELVQENAKALDIGKPNSNQIAQFIDEISYFWIPKLPLLEIELGHLTMTANCSFLAGAIYLGTAEVEPYIFKSACEVQIIADPFLKVGEFFRLDASKEPSNGTIEYFFRVLTDMLHMKDKYSDDFLILPIFHIAFDDKDQHAQIFNSFFYQVISGAFHGHSFSNEQEFFAVFKTYEDIESSMKSDFKFYFRYNTDDTQEQALRVKIENYIEKQIGIETLIIGKSEPEVFLRVTMTMISQALDIAMICSALNLVPYIRHNLTFHYFILVMKNFEDDEVLKTIYEKALIFYILGKTIDREKLLKMPFAEYCDKMKGKDILVTVGEQMKAGEIDPFSVAFKKIEAMLEAICREVLK